VTTILRHPAFLSAFRFVAHLEAVSWTGLLAGMFLERVLVRYAELGDRLVFVIPAGEMAAAIGQGGTTVTEAEQRLGRSVELVEDADTPESFVASALAPAAVTAVTISEQDDRVAYVEVVPADRGVAIGADGQNIETARTLAKRHYDVDDVQLT